MKRMFTTLLPILYIVLGNLYLVVYAYLFLETTPEQLEDVMLMLISSCLVYMLAAFIAILWAMWIVLLLIGGPMAFAVYYFKYVWPGGRRGNQDPLILHHK